LRFYFGREEEGAKIFQNRALRKISVTQRVYCRLAKIA
jgi:hypothetical protein